VRHHLGETWIDDEQMAYNTYSGAATGSNRKGYVRFPDGKLRRVTLGVADTFFSIPAKPSQGRIGYVSVWETPEPEWDRTTHPSYGEYLEYLITLPPRQSEYRFHSKHWEATH
jgi:hypothetical protein